MTLPQGIGAFGQVNTTAAVRQLAAVIQKGTTMDRAKKKKKKAMPLLSVAVFCERVLEEKDNLTTLVRLMDQVVVTLTQVAGPGDRDVATIPTTQTPLRLGPPIWMFLAFKSGEAKGTYKISIDEISPANTRSRIAETDGVFLGDSHGINVRSEFGAPFQEGLYWYEIRVEGHLMTRMPLKILHVKQTQEEKSDVKALKGAE